MEPLQCSQEYIQTLLAGQCNEITQSIGYSFDHNFIDSLLIQVVTDGLILFGIDAFFANIVNPRYVLMKILDAVVVLAHEI